MSEDSTEQTQDPAGDHTAVRHVRVAEGLIERNVGGQTFVLTPDSQLHILENDTARHLWAHLCDAAEQGITAADLATSLIEKFDVEREAAISDVGDYLDHLLKVDVIEILPV